MGLKANFTKKIIINIILSLIVIIGVSYFIILPTSEDIKETKTKTENLRVNLEKKYIKGQNLRKLAESLKAIESKIPKLDEIFIKKNNAIDFITSLEETASKENINQRINLGSTYGTEEKGIYQKTSLELSSNGNFIDQMKYLAELESLKFYINIKSLEISRSGSKKVSSDKNGIKESNISMLTLSNVYWLND